MFFRKMCNNQMHYYSSFDRLLLPPIFNTCNAGYDILELYVLVQILFTTSKTKSDIQYSKLEFPHEFPNDLRLRTLENKEISGKSQIWMEIQPCVQSFFQKFNFGNSSQNTQKKISNFSCPLQFYRISLFYFKYFIKDCSWFIFCSDVHNYLTVSSFLIKHLENYANLTLPEKIQLLYVMNYICIFRGKCIFYSFVLFFSAD